MTNDDKPAWELNPYSKRSSHKARFTEDCRYDEALIARVVDLKKKQWFLIEIAELLNSEGYRTFRDALHTTVSVWKICYSKQAKKYWEI